MYIPYGRVNNFLISHQRDVAFISKLDISHYNSSQHIVGKFGNTVAVLFRYINDMLRYTFLHLILHMIPCFYHVLNVI